MFKYVFTTNDDRGYYPGNSIFCSKALKTSDELWEITKRIGMNLSSIEYIHNGFRIVSSECAEFNIHGNFILATII